MIPSTQCTASVTLSWTETSKDTTDVCRETPRNLHVLKYFQFFHFILDIVPIVIDLLSQCETVSIYPEVTFVCPRRTVP